MKVVGDVLNDEERSKVINPYAENSGPKWNLTDIKRYIDCGLDEIEKDEKLKEEIEKGISDRVSTESGKGTSSV